MKNKPDIRVDLYSTKKHPMKLMKECNMKCESLASVPLGDCWFIWGADWKGSLPVGFKISQIPRDIPEFNVGNFTDGITGISSALPSCLAYI
jgi:hypothetical protein